MRRRPGSGSKDLAKDGDDLMKGGRSESTNQADVLVGVDAFPIS